MANWMEVQLECPTCKGEVTGLSCKKDFIFVDGYREAVAGEYSVWPCEHHLPFDLEKYEGSGEMPGEREVYFLDPFASGGYGEVVLAWLERDE